MCAQERERAIHSINVCARVCVCVSERERERERERESERWGRRVEVAVVGRDGLGVKKTLLSSQPRFENTRSSQPHFFFGLRV